MTEVDVSLIEAYLPIFTFLLVFIVLYAILAKTKILGESKAVGISVSLLVAIIFTGLTSAREYVVSITPWFAVLLIITIFILMLVGTGGKIPEGLTKGIGVAVMIVMIVIFLVSAYFTFSTTPAVEAIADFVSKPRIYGAVILVVLGAIVAFVLAKAN